MIPMIRDLIHDFFEAAGRMQTGTWTYVFIAVVIFGALCLRGYGSRSNY